MTWTHPKTTSNPYRTMQLDTEAAQGEFWLTFEAAIKSSGGSTKGLFTPAVLYHKKTGEEKRCPALVNRPLRDTAEILADKGFRLVYIPQLDQRRTKKPQ